MWPFARRCELRIRTPDGLEFSCVRVAGHEGICARASGQYVAPAQVTHEPPKPNSDPHSKYYVPEWAEPEE
jgi:hypothetical protein